MEWHVVKAGSYAWLVQAESREAATRKITLSLWQDICDRQITSGY